ncbi:MAG: DUF58 domain-containing protein [Bacteroidetes bacterium]|nr:DUF58 domain-containing protein [Bacteroidota bacterium]
METKELLKKVRKIEIKTRGLSNHIFSGEYHSAFKGRGMSFSEVRDYQYGDDIRNIDWNVTARFNSPFVKIYEEERELTVMLLVDVSKSAFLGTITEQKNQIITEICAVLAFSAINNNDKVGLILFSDEIELFIPPKKGKSHILRMIRELLDHETKSGKTDIKGALEYFHSVIKKRSIAFLLSDYIDTGYSDSLSIAARRHDIIGINVFDPIDRNLPNIGIAQIFDVEVGTSSWIDTSNKKVRDAYANAANEKKDYFKSSFLKCGSDTLDIQTDQPYVNALMKFFKKRM